VIQAQFGQVTYKAAFAVIQWLKKNFEAGPIADVIQKESPFVIAQFSTEAENPTGLDFIQAYPLRAERFPIVSVLVDSVRLQTGGIGVSPNRTWIDESNTKMVEYSVVAEMDITLTTVAESRDQRDKLRDGIGLLFTHYARDNRFLIAGNPDRREMFLLHLPTATSMSGDREIPRLDDNLDRLYLSSLSLSDILYEDFIQRPSPVINVELVPFGTTEFVFSLSTDKVVVGETFQFEIQTPNSDHFVWYTDLPEVGVINQEGLFVAVAPGEVTIFVIDVLNGETIKQTVTVER